MVEYSLQLDRIFSCLADPTRRDILRRITEKAMTIGQIAESYKLTFAAISKHLKVLEKAKLVIKHRQGKQQYVQLAPAGLKNAAAYLDFYKKMWEDRLDSLENYLNTLQSNQ